MGHDNRHWFGGVARSALMVGACVALANCAASDKFASRVDPKYGVSASPRVVESGDAVPRGGGVYRVGKPYVVAGRTYVPEENTNYRAEGLASWYGDDFHGRRTANGEIFDMTSISAAHPTLPLPSYVRVTNARNGKSVIVRVNDRGPYHGNRIIDVSHRAAKLLEFDGHGVAKVRVEYVGRAPIDGSDDRQLLATLRTGEPAPKPSAVMVASAKPFIPEVPAGSRLARGAVPVPAGRPYTLGNSEADVASHGATSEMSGSRGRFMPAGDRARAGTYEVVSSRSVEVNSLPAIQSQQAAFAPVERSNPGGVLSGRGLY